MNKRNIFLIKKDVFRLGWIAFDNNSWLKYRVYAEAVAERSYVTLFRIGWGSSGVVRDPERSPSKNRVKL